VKRPFSFVDPRTVGLVASGTGLIAATYGLVRLAYGLFLPDVQAELSFGATTAGLISAGASVVYCLGAIIGFFVAARHPRSLVIAAALSASLGAAGMAASAHTGTFATFAIVGSAGAGLASPGLVSIIRRNVTDAANEPGQAIVNAGTGPGLVAAGILALMLLPDWRLAWFVVAAFTLAIGAAVLVLDRRQASEHSGPGVPSRSWFWEHRHIILAAFFLGAGSAAVWNYGRTNLVDAGASEPVSVAAWIALGIGGTAVIGTARRMSTLHPRTAWTITSLVIAGASATLGLAPNTTIVALIACGAFGWGFTAGTGALIAWTTRIDAARAPAGTSLLFVVLVFGQALGAFAIGVLVSSTSFAVAFLVATAITLAATVTPFCVRSRPSADPAAERNEHRSTASTSASSDAAPVPSTASCASPRRTGTS
jgi:predicted MFS family arabinose efflux permease